MIDDLGIIDVEGNIAPCRTVNIRRHSKMDMASWFLLFVLRESTVLVK